MRIRCALLGVLLVVPASLSFGQRIELTVPSDKPLNGHVGLVFARNDKDEPRMQLSEDYLSEQGFGVDVADLQPGKTIVADAKTWR